MSNVPQPHCPVVELRQYTLRPGQRDTLVDLFDREFIDTQEALGMTVLGQFRDLDHADRFVWLRGFKSMAARAEALAAFYDGPVWQAHREAANATMLDSDNVLLLRSATAAPPIEAWERNALPVGAHHQGGLLAVICPLASAPDAHWVDRFTRALAPALAHNGGTLVGCYATESSPNNFPRLPVREGEPVRVWLARFAVPEGCDRVAAELKSSHDGLEWTGAHLGTHIGALTGAGFSAPLQVLRLAPTARSRF